MPANPRKGKSLKCTENLRDFYENEDEFSFTEGKDCLYPLSFSYRTFPSIRLLNKCITIPNSTVIKPSTNWKIGKIIVTLVIYLDHSPEL